MKRIAAAGMVFLMTAVLRPAGPEARDLLGPLTRDKILEAFPEWRSEMEAYAPLWAPLDRIRSTAVPVRIEVYLSTSRDDSRALAGRLFRILDQTDNPHITAWIMGLPGGNKPLGLQAAAKRVDRTPTLIIFIEGRESGRIVGLPESRLEEQMAGLFPDPPLDDAPGDDDILFDMDFFRFTPHTHLNIDCTECHSPQPQRRTGPDR